MDDLLVPPLDRRLQKRYGFLVQSHIHHAQSTAAGPTAALGDGSAFACTQAAWRFLNNDQVTLESLQQPLIEKGGQRIASSDHAFALLAHDWSKLDYKRHPSKQDTATLTHENDVGYELASALLIDAHNGAPIAPMQMHLKTAEGFHSTCPTPPRGDPSHLDQVLPTMAASAAWRLPRSVVHVIDREADSVGHYRQWDDAGHLFLVRADDDRRVIWNESSFRLHEVIDHLAGSDAFVDTRGVEYRGRAARQQIAGTKVTLDRPALTRIDGKQRQVAGRPLDLRLIVSRVVDDKGRVLATWLLLTNVPGAVDGSTLALWYYWRWRIESFFKLLKNHGQQIEHWQQTTGVAIARRCLIAAMACVMVWELESQNSEEAVQLKELLIRLSGRQMKRGRPFTTPALLAGLFVLLPMLDLLAEHGNNLGDIRNLATTILPNFTPG